MEDQRVFEAGGFELEKEGWGMNKLNTKNWNQSQILFAEIHAKMKPVEIAMSMQKQVQEGFELKDSSINLGQTIKDLDAAIDRLYALSFHFNQE